MPRNEESPFRDPSGVQASHRTLDRVVLNIDSVGAKPDPNYRTVLVRLRLADDSYFEFEIGSADAQRLGHALNGAGGGVLSEATELRKALRVAVEGMESVPFGETVDGAWGEDFTKALMTAREVLVRG